MRAPAPTAALILGMGSFADDAGGVSRYVDDLAAALERAGADARVVLVDDVRAPVWRRLRALRRTAARVAASTSVVDAHFALYGLVALLPPLRRKPLVVHFHGPWADESSATRRESRVRASLKLRLERLVYRRAAAVVTVSNAFARVVTAYGVDPARVQVVPPGVDLERFSPGDARAARERLGLPLDGRIVVAVRRLVRRMGIDILLDAWPAVAAHDASAHLVIVGDGPERASIEARASDLERVHLLGAVDDDMLVDCYRAADVSVVPSRTLEGFGLVVLESLACGTPVVATDVDGLREALEGMQPDVLVAAEDAHALSQRIADAFAGTRPLPTRADARTHALRFSWDTVAAKHVQIYERAANRRLRVVYVDHCARLSGAELALARLLPALDVDAHVVLGEDGPLVSRLRRSGVSVDVLPFPARNLGRKRVGARSLATADGFHSLVYAFRLARRLRRLRPDLVHTNSLKAALYGGLAGRLARIPVVWHVHDRIAPGYLPSSAVRLVRAAARVLPRLVVANSNATLATLPGIAGRVVPNAVAPAETAKPNGSFVVGLVGRIAPWKGQHLFLEAFARAFPDGDEQATVVGAPLFGADEEKYDADLRRLAADLGLDRRVEFTGFRERVGDELARMDVLVHASLEPEPFGQVILEGMAAGLPVVAADAGGAAELVDDDSTGLLYRPGDANALAAALRRLADDPDLRERLGTAARLRSSDFSPDQVAAAMLDAYRSIR